jgi:glycosyltransferase involved in cell wall biosynthesis
VPRVLRGVRNLTGGVAKVSAVSREPKVSVVVPVFNPGRHFSYCVDSVLGQSLPADEFEAIFVDDGSTDGTGAVLDDLAAAYPHIAVIHIPNSGWPGRPRNIGTDAANGRYIQYLDNDDALGREALERLFEFAEANASDVVIGRYAGHHRSVARELFRETRPSVVDHELLAESLTVHKLFRKQFLDRNGLRFPEGRRRLEDQLVMTHAYLVADRVSVLSDYVCYYHIRRDDMSNAAYERVVPSGYYANLEEVMDVVEAHTTPGPARDAYARRSLMREMLGRLDGRSFREFDADYQRELFDVVHKLDQVRVRPHIRDSLPPPDRLRARLLHRGDFDALRAYSEHIAEVRGSATLTTAAWRDGALDLGFDLDLVTVDGAPMPFVEHDGGLYLDVPADLATAGTISWDDRVAGDAAAQARVDLVVRFRADSAEFYTSADITTTASTLASGTVAMTHHGRARLDLATGAGGAPLWSGIWDLYLRVLTCGFEKDVRLGALRAPGVAEALARTQLVAGDAFVRTYWTTPHDNLSLNVGRVANAGKSSLVPRLADVSVGSSGWPVMRLPFDATTSSIDSIRVRLANVLTGRVVVLPTALADALGAAVTVADGGIPGHGRPRYGHWRLAVVVADRVIDTGALFSVSLAGRTSIRAYSRPRPPGVRLAVTAGRVRSRAGRMLRRGE